MGDRAVGEAGRTRRCAAGCSTGWRTGGSGSTAHGRPAPRSVGAAGRRGRPRRRPGRRCWRCGRAARTCRSLQSLTKLLADEAVPFLAAYRLQGLRAAQARGVGADLGPAAPRGRRRGRSAPIPVPPKYTSADFRKTVVLAGTAASSTCPRSGSSSTRTPAGRPTRPRCSAGPAGTTPSRPWPWPLIIGAREAEGWADERLVPLVAGLAELQPWVRAVARRDRPDLRRSAWPTFCRRAARPRAQVARRRRADACDAPAPRWRPAAASPRTTRQRHEATGMSTLLRDVIDIPERAGAEDYVLRLTDGVGDGPRRARPSTSYVVTAGARRGLRRRRSDLVADAVTTGISRGAFLTGSFGSGKSHFMAVLHALLRHDPAARAEGRAAAGHRHSTTPSCRTRRSCRWPSTCSAPRSMEQALLRRLRPPDPRAAPRRAAARRARVRRAARRRRAACAADWATTRFFAGLNGGGGAGDGEADPWAARARRRHLDRRDATTRPAPPRPAHPSAAAAGHRAGRDATSRRYTQQAELRRPRHRPGRHLRRTPRASATTPSCCSSTSWCCGWRSRCRTASSSAASRRSSPSSSSPAVGGRAIPLISFVARQMDLRRWFADAGASGAEQEALDRAFRHQEGRFAHDRPRRRQPARTSPASGCCSPRTPTAERDPRRRVRRPRPARRRVGRAARRRQHRRAAPRRRRGGVPADLPVLPGAGLHAARRWPASCSASAPRSRSCSRCSSTAATP